MTAGSKGTVLVTGASSGVGNSLVRHLAGPYRVLAVARRIDRLERDFGDVPTVATHEVDLADLAGVRAFCDELLTDGEEVTHIVNNAGINYRETVTSLPLEAMTHSLDVNALAPLTIMQAFLPAMQARDFGRIVNVTSGAPLNCFPGFAAYSGSKALLNAITVTAAKEHEDANIRINLMSPGPVRSEMAPDAALDPAACHPTLDHLLEIPEDGPTGRFFWLGHEVPLTPDLAGVDWLRGEANGRLQPLDL
jgi:short-subunit dehydrogenase